MKEDKLVDPVKQMFKECGVPVKMIDCTQPSPPMPRPDRPDVDEIREEAVRIGGVAGSKYYADRVLGLCDWIKELEARLKALEKEKQYIIDCDIGKWQVIHDKLDKSNSHLAAVVKAGKKHGVSHWGWCRKSENTGVSCTCGFVEIAAALIAAEEQLGESKGKS